MVLITRLPTRSFKLALEPIPRFLLEPTNRHMIAIQQLVYLSTRSLLKMKAPSMANQNISQFKIQNSNPSTRTDSRTFTIKNNYEAGTCNYTETFQYVYHHSPISTITLARSTQIKKYIRHSYLRIINAQSSNVMIHTEILLVLYLYLLLQGTSNTF